MRRCSGSAPAGGGLDPADLGHRQGDEGRPPEMPRRRRRRTTSRSWSTSTCCWRCCGCGSARARRLGASRRRSSRRRQPMAARVQTGYVVAPAARPTASDLRAPSDGPKGRARILLVDDDERNLLALSEVLATARRRGHRHFGRGCAARAAQGRLRGHPARRVHARHGRLRDRRADPPARADRAHPDHLPVGGQQGRPST